MDSLEPAHGIVGSLKNPEGPETVFEFPVRRRVTSWIFDTLPAEPFGDSRADLGEHRSPVAPSATAVNGGGSD
jgi:hypothetical protein